MEYDEEYKQKAILDYHYNYTIIYVTSALLKQIMWLLECTELSY